MTTLTSIAAAPTIGRRRRGPRRPLAVTLLAAVATLGSLALAGVAYAWVGTQGTGSASASTSGLQAVTVTALSGGDAPTGSLQPGGTADAILRITNPNPYPVTLVATAPNGAVTATGGIGTCGTTGVTVVAQSGLHVVLAASATTLVDLPGAAAMSNASSSGCQGATFTLPIAITVHSP
jgi:hypothetical protein